MAYLLKLLLLLMFASLVLTNLSAHGFIILPWGHISIAMPVFIYTIFTQTLVMFYFIGTARLTRNVHQALQQKRHLKDLFEKPPADLTEYQKTVSHLNHQASLSKRGTIPWTMLILTLGSIAFLLGAAYDTGLVEKTTHSGVAYGFSSAMILGTIRQWHFLSKNHLLLRKLKLLFEIPRSSM